MQSIAPQGACGFRALAGFVARSSRSPCWRPRHPLSPATPSLGWKAFTRARAPEPDSVWGGPALDTIADRLRALAPGEAFAAVSPWGLALASGRDGLLLPNRLDPGRVSEFLRGYPEVKVVVLRPGVPHDRLTPEPLGYVEELSTLGSAESVGGVLLFRLR